MKLTTIAAVATAASLSAGAASAATFNIADGGIACDSYNLLQASTKALCDNTNNDDLGQDPAASSVTFAENGTLIGFVRDLSGTNNELYADNAEVKLAGKSKVTFEIFNFDSIFAGTFSFGNVFAPTVMDSGNTLVEFVVDAGGPFEFIFDAALPNNGTDNTTEYSLTVAAVPLPASSLLLLGGVAAFGAMRRKQA